MNKEIEEILRTSRTPEEAVRLLTEAGYHIYASHLMKEFGPSASSARRASPSYPGRPRPVGQSSA